VGDITAAWGDQVPVELDTGCDVLTVVLDTLHMEVDARLDDATGNVLVNG